ncbi:hypothetical protein B9J78_03655 [bacterium Unc6]|nr:hypothetical protein [bacterium Unc6]
MSKEEKWKFKRTMNEELKKKLIEEPLYKQLLPDIKDNGEVFPAIRNEVIDFYHYGGRLFSYDKEGFKTHVKYASAYKEYPEAYITELMLGNLKQIQSFTDGYERIKENCSLYSGVEAQGVSKIYENHSFASSKTKNSSVVVLDIEVSFEAIEEDRLQDRIDILLFEKEKNRLIFCEVKHFSNSEIWAEKVENIKVVEQIRRYTDQIKDKEGQIIAAYNNYTKIVNDLFQISLPEPEKICPTVPLIIFGFDRDQLKGRFKDLFKEKIERAITYYPIGSVSSIKLENLIKQCK